MFKFLILLSLSISSLFASLTHQSTDRFDIASHKVILAIEANAGQVDSMLELAHLYYKEGLKKYRIGRIKEKDNYELKKAFNYFDMCAEKRNPECLYYSALMQYKSPNPEDVIFFNVIPNLEKVKLNLKLSCDLSFEKACKAQEKILKENE